MATYEARIKFADVRVITIEAETDEEAAAKFDAGDWADETTIDFYTMEILNKLAKKDRKMMEAWDGCERAEGELPSQHMQRIWRAMIAASPQGERAPDEGGRDV